MVSTTYTPLRPQAIPQSPALRVGLAIVGTCLLTGALLSIFPMIFNTRFTSVLPESWAASSPGFFAHQSLGVNIHDSSWHHVAAAVNASDYRDAPEYRKPLWPLAAMPTFQEIPETIYEQMARQGKRVPNIVHWFWFTDEDRVSSQKDFPFLYYLSIRSAMVVIRPDILFLHCNGLPSGPWWDALAPHMTVNYFKNFDAVYGNPILAAAQKTDVIRILALNHYGGIAFDMDTFAINDHEELRYAPATIALQDHNRAYACAAWLMYERNAHFGELWLQAYKDFDSAFWDVESGQTPFMIAKAYPNHVQLLGPKVVFSPNWEHGKKVLVSDQLDLIGDGHYAYHGWHRSASAEFDALNPYTLRDEDFTINRVLRRYLDEESFRIWDELSARNLGG